MGVSVEKVQLNIQVRWTRTRCANHFSHKN
jgi:hypothetical protein